MTRPSAPGRLAVAQAFLNTNDLESHLDELATPEALGAWLTAAGLVSADTKLGADDLARTIRFREALRDLLEAHHSTPARPPPPARWSKRLLRGNS